MKSILNKIIEYLLFGLLNLFFANPWWSGLVMVSIGMYFQRSIEDDFNIVFFIAWLLLVVLRLFFVEICYKKLKHVREFLDTSHSVRELLDFGLMIDLLSILIQCIINIYVEDGSEFTPSLNQLLTVYPFMLGGVTLSYLSFALRKKHFQIKGYNKE